MKFDFYGIIGEVLSDRPELLEDLRKDFEYFHAPNGAGAPAFSVSIRHGSGRGGAKGRTILSTSLFRARQSGSRREVDYNGRALSVFDAANDRITIDSADVELARELSYLAVCSRAGWHLDLKGFHRVHALGFSYNGINTLVVLPSGGGKSTLCLGLSRRSGVGILSDDTPLISGDGTMHPFPLRWGFCGDADVGGVLPLHLRRMTRRRFGEKILVDYPHFKDRVGRAARPGLIVVGARSLEAARVAPAGALRIGAQLLDAMVLGRGTPQLAEYLFPSSLTEAAGLFKIARSRAAAARALVCAARGAYMRFGPDLELNERLLLELVGRLN